MKIDIELNDLYLLFPSWSKRRCQDLLTDIRQANGKRRGAPVTIREFCKYQIIDEDEVRAALNPVKKAG
jgi:hypothetical protein